MAHVHETDSTDAADAGHSTDPAGELIDQPLAQDIELLGDVVVAAADADQVMTEPEVDEALGVSPSGEGYSEPVTTPT